MKIPFLSAALAQMNADLDAATVSCEQMLASKEETQRHLAAMRVRMAATDRRIDELVEHLIRTRPDLGPALLALRRPQAKTAKIGASAGSVATNSRCQKFQR